jgi:hairy-and-enhancer-of-split protein
MKPLLERKRRARINKCLDELKDIMTVALQAQGENVSKLEKADILELTVRHLHKLQSSHRLMLNPRHPLEEVQRFQAGYSSCAQEAASFLLSSPGVDVRVSQRLLSHLSSNLNNPVMAAAAATGAAPGGFHSPPPPVSSGCVQTKVEPPPRPSSNPVGGSTTLAHFTVAIAKAGSVGAGGGISGTEEDDDEEDLRMGGHALLKPEAIRLNPGDKNMWRPF